MESLPSATSVGGNSRLSGLAGLRAVSARVRGSCRQLPGPGTLGPAEQGQASTGSRARADEHVRMTSTTCLT